MGTIVDLREKNIGEEAPGGAIIDECPRCKLPGLWVDSGPQQRESYAHVVDADTFRVIQGCHLDMGGTA